MNVGDRAPCPARLAREGEVDVWQARLDLPAALVRHLGRCLSPAEVERVGRLRFADHRRRLSVSRALLRHLLGVYVDRAPERLRFRPGAYGKPELELEPDDGSGVAKPSEPRAVARQVDVHANHGEERPLGRVSFNLSHSEERLLIAVASAPRVGVDIERVRAFREVEGIARRVFSPREQTVLRSHAPEQRSEAFLRGWTRKEAVAKALGQGLAAGLRRFEVTLDPGAGARLLSIDGEEARAAEWSLFDLACVPGYAAALAVEGSGWTVRLGRLEPEAGGVIARYAA